MKRLKLKDGDKKIDCCENCPINNKSHEPYSGDGVEVCNFLKDKYGVSGSSVYDFCKDGEFHPHCPLPEWEEAPVDMGKLKENIKYAAGCGEDLRLTFSLVRECAEILGIKLED